MNTRCKFVNNYAVYFKLKSSNATKYFIEKQGAAGYFYFGWFLGF